ncbi:hypothetical protein P0W64_00575 [Tsukamurella sp. 8F]|uniref:hypothetical protein n=1 Tax=unclassified Tsukamurella TaxID=2633480 RepID=UPI0023B92029|nr:MULTISPECIES: hypothetical protein [unclassified Tsukamurella]MDF0531426.1 hypothetical protein [Tsukamurella sp. 8J]MDF0585268.1 hypothetical protein [Tsukamurella sp. 8F]
MSNSAPGRRVLDAFVGSPLSWIVGRDKHSGPQPEEPGERTARSFERLASWFGLVPKRR